MAIGFANSEPVSGVAGRCLNLFSAFYNVGILFRLLSSVCLLSVVCVCVQGRCLESLFWRMRV